MMEWNDGHADFADWLLMLTMMIPFWALVVFGIVFAIRSNQRAVKSDDDTQATKILDERLARGEIDANEYQERRRLLESSK